MSILFDKEKQVFKIDTNNSSYIFQVIKGGMLEHLYYGKRISDVDVSSIAIRQIYSFADHEDIDDRTIAPSVYLSEYSVFSNGDTRIPSLVVSGNNPSKRLRYYSHKIYHGKNPLDGMPSSRSNDNVETLEICLINDDNTLKVKLFYSAYYDGDIICRHTEIENISECELYVSKASSLTLDFYENDFSLLTLEGMYLCERSNVNIRKITKGVQGNFSQAGTTSHSANPFFALLKGNADENQGEVYGFNLIYSSNFKNEIEVNRLGYTRVQSGINDTGFNWQLKKGDIFTCPEAIMTYSCNGIGGMSRNFHDHIRISIIDEKYRDNGRPIVINTWEGCYFDVNDDFIEGLIRASKKCGIDTIVLDDGWFRNDTKHGLGDWVAIKEKFASLKTTSAKIHEQGLKFGIWIEPEMVAIESELFKNDQNIALTTEKNPLYCRNQMAIDLTVDKNVEMVANRIIDELSDVQIDYIKWDCNKYITDATSHFCPEGEVYHRQMLGVYKLFDRITAAFPDAMIENCSGGGGRFDLGMLYYSPQIWTSDNTDPYERLYIQYGTSFAYPASSMSCHFSEGVCTSGRPSRFDFRYAVASFGAFGYELNLNNYDESNLERFNEFSKIYRNREKFVLNSDLYRIISPESETFCAYMQVLKDKSQALLSFFEINTRGFTESMVIRLFGLDDDRLYTNTQNGVTLSGKAWKNVGLRMGDLFNPQFGKGGSARQILFVAVDD